MDKAVFGQLIALVSNLGSSFDKSSNQPRYEPVVKQIAVRCEVQFKAEIGDYDIFIIADTPYNESIMQKFKVKV